jgi:hypothetical protein
MNGLNFFVVAGISLCFVMLVLIFYELHRVYRAMSSLLDEYLSGQAASRS